MNEADGFAFPLTALLANGATLRNAAGLDALLAHAAVGDDPAYVVDTAAPGAPAIESVTDDVGNVLGGVVVGGTTDDTRPVVRVNLFNTGAELGDTVQLRDGSAALGVAVTLSAADVASGYVDITTPALTPGGP